MIIKIKEIPSAQAKSMVINGLESIQGEDSLDPRFRFWNKAYNKAVSNNLRINQKTETIRDNRLGELERLSDMTQAEFVEKEAAQFRLAHRVWCDCCKYHNLENL